MLSDALTQIKCDGEQNACERALKSILDYFETRSYLADILIAGITAWFDGRQDLDSTIFPSSYHRLIIQQNSIGWRQLFNGRLSLEWSRLQGDYLFTSRLATRSRTGKLWTTTVITCLWKQWQEVWTLRNEAVHGHDETTRRLILRKKAEWQVRQIYDNRDLYLPNDRDVLFDNVDEHLEKSSTTALLNWYSTYQPMFAHSIREAKKRAIQGVRSIRSYFQPRSSVVGPLG